MSTRPEHFTRSATPLQAPSFLVGTQKMKNRVAASLVKKPIHRRKHRKRSFKRKVKNYLKADCFLYAPLLSHQPSDLSPPSKTVDSSAAGLSRNETSRTHQKKKLLQRILEYLQSDSHMYGAFIDAPKEAPASGPVHRFEKLTIAISRRKTTVTHKPVSNPTPAPDVTEDTNRVSDGEARRSRRSQLSPKSGAMNRELRRLVT